MFSLNQQPQKTVNELYSLMQDRRIEMVCIVTLLVGMFGDTGGKKKRRNARIGKALLV